MNDGNSLKPYSALLFRLPIPTYAPSLSIVRAFLNTETRNALSLSLAALITGALSQVETTIELTNRVCDQYFMVKIGRI